MKVRGWESETGRSGDTVQLVSSGCEFQVVLADS
jgi:hypothetical protein